MATVSVLNQNQFLLAPQLGAVYQGSAPNTKSVRLNPSSVATVIVPGQAVKLIDSTAKEIVVDVISAGDVPYGVIQYNPKKSTYVKGDVIEIGCVGNVVWMETSAAIVRGARVVIDPTGPTIATATAESVGVALEKASATGALIPVEIDPRAVAGYTVAGAGIGGTVTQATNRSTGVTLSKLSGAITTNTASLAAGASATFTVTNTTVAITDTIILSIRSGQTNKETRALVSAVAAGSFDITVHNNHGATAETGAIIINFLVQKAVAS